MNGLRLPPPPAECIDDTGMVTLRFWDIMSPAAMACAPLGSGIEASGCWGASWG